MRCLRHLLTFLPITLGIQPPAWLARMATEQNGEGGQNGHMTAQESAVQKKLVNGHK